MNLPWSFALRSFPGYGVNPGLLGRFPSFLTEIHPSCFQDADNLTAPKRGFCERIPLGEVAAWDTSAFYRLHPPLVIGEYIPSKLILDDVRSHGKALLPPRWRAIVTYSATLIRDNGNGGERENDTFVTSGRSLTRTLLVRRYWPLLGIWILRDRTSVLAWHPQNRCCYRSSYVSYGWRGGVGDTEWLGATARQIWS